MIKTKDYFTKETKQDQIIYITSDIHYLSPKFKDPGEAYKKYISSGDGKQLAYIDEIMTAFSYDIQRTNPDILIISGDLTCNGEKESHEDLASKLKDIEKSGTSVFVIPGNHDINNPWARSFKADKQYVAQSISDKEFSELYADFGYNEAISRDKASLSYLAKASEDIWLLMLDTNKYKNNKTLGYPEADGVLGKVTLDWINECSTLAKEKGATIITVMHHNILDHSDIIRDGYTLNNSGQAYIRFKENALNLVFSGHIHTQDISSDKKVDNTMYDIASGALSVNPHQYGILKYSSKDNSFDYNTMKVDVEGWAKKEKIKDKNILNFSEYSEEYFGSVAYNKAYQTLSKAGSYSEEEMKAMSEVMKLLNIRYFAGTEDLNTSDLLQSKGYQLWSDYTKDFHQYYVHSIIEDKDTYDNRLHIEIGR